MTSAQAIKLNPFAIIFGRDLLSGEFRVGKKGSI